MQKIIIFLCSFTVFIFAMDKKGFTQTKAPAPAGDRMLRGNLNTSYIEGLMRGDSVPITIVNKTYDGYVGGSADWANEQMKEKGFSVDDSVNKFTVERTRYYFASGQIGYESVAGKRIHALGIRADGTDIPVVRDGRKDEYLAYFSLSRLDSTLADTPENRIYFMSCGPSGCGNYAKPESVEKPKQTATVPRDSVVEKDTTVYSYVTVPRDSLVLGDSVIPTQQPYQQQQPYPQPYQQPMQMGGGYSSGYGGYSSGYGGGLGGSSMLMANNGNTYNYSPYYSNSTTTTDNSTHDSHNTTVTTPDTVHHNPPPVPNPNPHDSAGPPTDLFGDHASNPTSPDSAGMRKAGAGKNVQSKISSESAQSRASSPKSDKATATTPVLRSTSVTAEKAGQQNLSAVPRPISGVNSVKNVADKISTDAVVGQGNPVKLPGTTTIGAEHPVQPAPLVSTGTVKPRKLVTGTTTVSPTKIPASSSIAPTSGIRSNRDEFPALTAQIEKLRAQAPSRSEQTSSPSQRQTTNASNVSQNRNQPATSSTTQQQRQTQRNDGATGRTQTPNRNVAPNSNTAGPQARGPQQVRNVSNTAQVRQVQPQQQQTRQFPQGNAGTTYQPQQRQAPQMQRASMPAAPGGRR